jgi:YidC/Oxa1 family membrane protein insertase
MDRKTLIAVVLIGLFLVFYYPLLHLLGLDRYLGDRRGAPRPAAVVDTVIATAGAVARNIRLETPLYDALFSSAGARLVSVELKQYATAHGVSTAAGRRPPHPHGKEGVPPGDRVVLAGAPLFGLDLGSGAARRALTHLVYTAEESTDASGEVRAIHFTARDTSGLFVRQTYRVRAGDYALDYEVEIRGVPAAWRITEYSLTTRSWPLFTEADLPGDHRALRATSLVGTNLHRETPGGLLKGPRRFEGNAEWAGVHTRYFFATVAALHAVVRGVESGGEMRGLTETERQLVGSNAKPEEPVAINSLVIALPGETSPTHQFLLYVGPNDVSRLATYKLGLEKSVDLGWSWIVPFSKALLRLLKWIHAVVLNWGLAILALATLVRMVLHPLNVSSLKSMRAMQRLQPEIERIKEKYKKDAQAMNTAVMALYKENKVNPAGGCLPMVIQMPVFFALYSVLFNAIELRQAPFVGWIQDLSAPDLLGTVAGFPLRLLPILMAGSGLLQQKLAPTDPRQASSMYMMNVVMVVFFYNLPSGLVLYWTVMNLLTALQQWIVLHQDGGSPPVPAVAAAGGKGRR